MPAKIFGWMTAIALGLSGTASTAQSSGLCGVVAVGAAVFGTVPKTNAPYSATVVTTHDQKLADGNVIHGSATTQQARDSEGGTRSETSAGCIYGEDGQLHPVVRVSIYDPITRTSLSWSTNDGGPKIVRVFHRTERVAAAPSTTAAQQVQPRVRPPAPPRARNENLGIKTIAGVMAEGSRTVRTIPAGQEGNEQPMEVLDEMWVAKDIGLAMLKISDDPRSGRTTTEVTELNQGEPDAALFAAPAGYTMEEQVVKVVSSAGTP